MNRLALLLLAACQPPSARAPLVEGSALADLAGTWRWLHREVSDGTIRIEDEQWRIRPMPGSKLAARYLRTVDIESTDRLGFPCNQRFEYQQRAIIDVEIGVDGAGGFTAREIAYETEPSPCDHAFRHLATYKLAPRGNRVDLSWPDGSQTLWHIDEETSELARPWSPSPPAQPTGAWKWSTRSVDDDGNVREESEQWELARRDDARVDGSYRRRVTVTSRDGKPLACSGTPSWSYDDVYVLDGEREEQHWHFVERAFDGGTHPCIAATPKRSLDEATAEQIGDYLVFEWRGKRRQVLYR